MNHRLTIAGTVTVFLFASGLALAPPARVLGQEGAKSDAPKRVVKSDREWAKELTHSQYLVTRLKYTEPAFSGKYLNSHSKGTYQCVCCGSPLFSSRTKFHSGTGWPSFYQPLDEKLVATAPDHEMAEPRVEVMCSTCGAHLGHVFADGPAPTGLRFCVNSLSLKFSPAPPASKPTKGKSARNIAKPKSAAARPAK